MIRIYSDTTSPSISDTIRVNGIAFDLTGSSVSFRMRQEDSATTKVDFPAVITSSAAGTVRYDWQSGDTDTPGDFVGWWHVTLANGKTQDTSEFALKVLDHAEVTGDLCALADVRLRMEIDAGDTSRDELLTEYIHAASAAITREYQREFAPTASATRSFRWHGLTLSLAPYDLRAATQVRIDAQTGSPTTLTTTTDYMLLPVGAPSGVFTSLRLSPYLVASADFVTRYGWSEVEVTGSWGFASVPADVRQACAVTVESWARRDFGNFNVDLAEGRALSPDVPINYSIPPPARRLLAPYRRPQFF